MKCEICGRRSAVVFVQQISGAGKTEIRLCAECARENGLSRTDGDIAKSVAALLASLPETKKPTVVPQRERVCGFCGSSLEDLKKRGAAGCPACYDSFAAELFKKTPAEGSPRHHTGRLPFSIAAERDRRRALAMIRAELTAAVEAEDYEKAALCRDRARALERDSDVLA